MSATTAMTRDGHPIRCLADTHVKRAKELRIGDRFIDRAEDLRGRGITPLIVAAIKDDGTVVGDAEGIKASVEFGPEDWVVWTPNLVPLPPRPPVGGGRDNIQPRGGVPGWSYLKHEHRRS